MDYPPKPPWIAFPDLLTSERPICDIFNRRLGDFETRVWFSFLMTLSPAALQQYAVENPAPLQWEYAYYVPSLVRDDGVVCRPLDVDGYLLAARQFIAGLGLPQTMLRDVRGSFPAR